MENDSCQMKDQHARKILQATWDSLSPPNMEEDIVGRWYGVAYETKRSSMLFIGKILQRFLLDEERPANK